MLIVDDMEVERISFAEIFKDEYQILEAENGKQAMEQLEQQKVHIVLLDTLVRGGETVQQCIWL